MSPPPSPAETTATNEAVSSGRFPRLRAVLGPRLGVDIRALAAFRIGLGSVLLLDLLLRSRDLVAFYTDAGVLPRPVLWATVPTLSQFSIHTLSGAAWYQGVLFVIAGGCAAALALGYRTRTAAVLSWLLLVSLHARNPEVLNGGDSVLRRVLFWSLFLPLGARWSLDARWRETEGWRGLLGGRLRGLNERVVSVASAGLLSQVVLVYTVNAAFKLRGDDWTGGSALAQVLALETFTTPLGSALAEYGTVLSAVETLWLAMVLSSGLLLVLTGWPRALFASMFVGAHLSMFLTMRLGLFPLIAVVALVPFLPPTVWDRLDTLAPTWERAPKPLRGVGRRLSEHLGGGRSRSRESTRSTGRIGRTRGALRALGSAAGVALLAFLLVWNAMAVGYVATPEAVESAVDPAEHSWNMFANPPTADVWVVAPATTESGERVDALHGGSLRWEPPPAGTAWYPNARWRKYLHSTWHTDDEALLGGIADGLCRRWNSAHRTDLERVELHVIILPTAEGDPRERSLLSTRECVG